MRSFLFLFSGIFAVLYLSWPSILIKKKFEMFNQIIENSAEEKISIKALMDVSPCYIF